MQNILEIEDLKKTFTTKAGHHTAVDGVSLFIAPGEALGLVGESGCGKSTLAKAVTFLDPPDSGRIKICGREVTAKNRTALKEAYKNIQMVFQDPLTSFDPSLTLGKSIGAVLKKDLRCPKAQAAQITTELLTKVGLSSDYANALPTEISGGECQRAAIARAIALKPKLLICDEATSALDVSVQAQIIDLLASLGRDMEMSFLFISHDLALVTGFCDRVAVMYNGKIVEAATSHQILTAPQHPYTKALLGSWDLNSDSPAELRYS
ncbi:MAG: ABC transporter ATP-binding protein [Bacillota bacterium]|nr:ABC transporter ATP-binding protein [Bacillota bacterium]